MATIKQKKLQELAQDIKHAFKEAENELTREEFLEAFREVVGYVKQIKQSNLKEVQAMRGVAKKHGEELDKKLENAVERLENTVETLSKAVHGRVAKELNYVHDKVSSLENGKDADEEYVIERVLSQLPKVPELEPVGIRNRLEELDGEERLDVSAIRGLEDFVKKYASGGGIKYVGGGVNVAENQTTILTATGAVNGSNADYVFAKKPQFIIVNGAQYRESNGWSWTASTSTATLDFAPATNSDVYGTI